MWNVRSRWLGALVVWQVSWLVGCGAGSDLGATPGGSQDEALAKEKIARGQVPLPEDVTVEGVLASHDLPLDAPVCESPLCVNSAYAVAPTLDDRRSAVFVQIGFDSGVDAESFKRLPLNLSVVIDRSGSMAGDKMTSTKTALTRLVDQLTEADRLSLVLFDDRVDVLLPSTHVTDKPNIRRLISSIEERGSTNLSAGLSRGFELVDQFAGEAGVSDRVVVLTDAIANTGSADVQSFIALANDAAKRGIGLTVFGVGMDLNQQLVVAISKLRGGNYAFLADRERIASVFDDDFEYLVTPLAYDLRFQLTPAPGLRVHAVYGFPSWPTASSSVQIDVATVFLSRGHGALVARLEPIEGWPEGDAPLADLSLSYDPADGSESRAQVFTSVYDGAEPLSDDSHFYSQVGVRRTVAYVNAALAEKQACTLYWNFSTSEAIGLLDRAEGLLNSEAVTVEDEGLFDEANVIAELRSNMQGSRIVADAEYPDRGGWLTPSCSVVVPRSSHGSAWLALAVFSASASAVRRRRREAMQRDRMLAATRPARLPRASSRSGHPSAT